MRTNRRITTGHTFFMLPKLHGFSWFTIRENGATVNQGILEVEFSK